MLQLAHLVDSMRLNGHTVESTYMARKVAHIINGLGVGGAETMLINLLAATDPNRYESVVVSLKDEGQLGPTIQSMGVPVHALNMRSSLPNPVKIFTLRRWLQQMQPDVILTWMYHANLFGGLASGNIPVMWAMHSVLMQPGQEKRATRWLQRFSARFSARMPERIVYVSKTAQSDHERLGYDPAKSVFIPNGFDTERFHPDEQDRQRVRTALNIPQDAPVVGYVARFHPLKGHQTFIRAAGRIYAQRPDVHFVLVGTDSDDDNAELNAWIDAAGVRDNVHLLGRRDDVPDLLRAFDLFALASDGEAFPMALGEAMASGLPAVVTDVGDSGYLLGEAGHCVPPRDADAFADACLKVLEDAHVYGQQARQRIITHFSLQSIADRYMALYDACLDETLQQKAAER